jgi:hypothetical protein
MPAPKRCFVIMPIGDQNLPSGLITATELRERYTDLIREAISRVRPDAQVVRADDVAAPGAITADIFSRLMEADYVVADITYPNPNVFYELGIRHACRSGTILIKEASEHPAPFDIYELRRIEYQNTPTGLKRLSDALLKQFDWIDENPDRPDNRFLELGSHIKPPKHWAPYPPAINSALEAQLHSKHFYKSSVVFLLDIKELYPEAFDMITHLDYKVTNRTSAPHHWQMQKRIREGGKALSVMYNGREVGSDALDFQYGRGLKIPRLLEPGETAAVSFVIQERVRLVDSDVYTSYHPATDLTVRVQNPFHRAVFFDFEPLYFGNIERPRQGYEMELRLSNGVLPFEGVRLHWTGEKHHGSDEG